MDLSKQTNFVTVVLLHGWGGTKNSVTPLTLTLEAKGFKTLVLELPGHGHTPPMNNAWSMQNFSEWLKSQIKNFKVKRFILVGHSFGGKIILDSVSRAVLKPEKIILINSSGLKPRNSVKKSLFGLMANFFKPIFLFPALTKLRYYIYKFAIKEVDYAKTSGTVRDSFKLINEEHYDTRLDGLRLPTLIIWAKQDVVTPLWMGQKLNSLIKGSELKLLDGTHGLPLKQPEQIANLLVKFINQ